MDPRLTTALIVVVGVPAVLVGYILATEQVLRLFPQRAQPRIRPWLWLLPALAFLFVFLIYPTIGTFVRSLQNEAGTQFIGLDNYSWFFGNNGTLSALKNSLIWVVLLTVLAAYQPPGTPQTGTLNAAVTSVGVAPQPWLTLSGLSLNTILLILVTTWIWTGFCMVIISAALKGINGELLEAARVDGATEWQVFKGIIFPLLLPTLAVVSTTIIITALKAFDIVYVMTNGNFDTQVIANSMYQEMFNFGSFGRGSAIAIVLMIAIVPVMAVNIRRFQAQEAIR